MRRAGRALATLLLALGAGTGALVLAPAASADEGGWIEIHGRYVITTCQSGGAIWCDEWTDSAPHWAWGKRVPAQDGRSVTMLSGWCRTDFSDGHSSACS